MRRVTKENLIVQIDRLHKIKDEQGQLSMSGEYTLQAYEMLLATMDSEPVAQANEENIHAVSDLKAGYVLGHADVAILRRIANLSPPVWIPVSERTPENKPGCYKYLVFETLNNRVNHDYWNVPDKDDEVFTPFWNHYGNHVTHWMPFPTFNHK